MKTSKELYSNFSTGCLQMLHTVNHQTRNLYFCLLGYGSIFEPQGNPAISKLKTSASTKWKRHTGILLRKAPQETKIFLTGKWLIFENLVRLNLKAEIRRSPATKIRWSFCSLLMKRVLYQTYFKSPVDVLDESCLSSLIRLDAFITDALDVIHHLFQDIETALQNEQRKVSTKRLRNSRLWN